MRIAIVIWKLDTYGGSMRQALELAAHLKLLKHDVEVCTYSLDQSRCFPELVSKLNIFTAKPITHSESFYHPSSTLFERIKSFLINIYVKNQQVSALAEILSKRHKIKPFDVINFHDNSVMSIAKGFPDVKSIWMLNDPPSFIDTYEKKASVFSNTLLLKSLCWMQSLITRFEIKSIDKIVVLDNRNKKIVQKYFQVTPLVIRSGLDISRSLKKYTPKPNRSKVTILSTNIFFRHRRYEDLVHALDILIHKKGVKNLRVRIVGDTQFDPGYFESIRALASSKGILKYITFLGKVNEKELNKEYQKADIFVFPNFNQTWGLSVFEAMAHRCACVVSRGCGAHEVLSDGKNALLFDAKQPTQIADHLSDLITNSLKRRKIARAGHAFVCKNISWKKYAQEMLAVFKN